MITKCYINNPLELLGQLYWKSPKPSSCQFSKMWTHVWFQQRTRTRVISVRHEWHCCLPSVSYCWPSFSSTVSHHFSLLQAVTLLCLFTWCQPLYASCCTVCTTVLFKVLYFTFKMFNFFVWFFFMYYLCEKYYKSIILQYYVASCVSWIPRLTSLDLKCALGSELVRL